MIRNLLLTAILLAPSIATAEVSDAIVRVGGASGICVDPRGLVMTARHLDLTEVVVVRFRDRNVTATRVYQCPEPDGPEVFDCAGDGYPFVRIAQVVPPRGSLVTSGGFPMQSPDVKWASGRMFGVARFTYDGQQLHADPTGAVWANCVGFATAPGWSGGPLFSEGAELCGLNLASKPRESLFATHASIRAAYAAAKRIVSSVKDGSATKELPALMVRCREQCPPCERFKADWETDAVFRKSLSGRYCVAIKTVKIDHPSALTDSFPTFHADGQSMIVGYAGKEKLLSELGITEKPAVKPSPTALAPPPPEDEPASPIVAEVVTAERPQFVPSAVSSLPLPPPPTVAVDDPVIPPIPQLTATHRDSPEVVAQPQPSGLGSAIGKVAGVASAAWTIAQWGGLIGATGGVGGLIMGGIALARTFRRITTTARAPPVAPVQPIATQPETPSQQPQPITIENPPPAQVVLSETRFTPVERDTFAQAHSWAVDTYVRRNPGAEGTMVALDALIWQYLESKGIKRTQTQRS